MEQHLGQRRYDAPEGLMGDGAPQPQMTLRQRQPRIRNPKFLAFVRTQRCGACGAPPPSQATHIRMASLEYGKRSTGVGEKSSDQWSVPLCQGCHLDKPSAQHRVGEQEFWSRSGLNPFAIAMGLYDDFMSAGRKPASRISRRPQRKKPKIKRLHSWPKEGKSPAGNSFNVD